MEYEKQFVSAWSLSVELGIPEEWIKKQTRDGKLPHLLFGKKMLFHPPSVLAALIAMAERNMQPVGQSPLTTPNP